MNTRVLSLLLLAALLCACEAPLLLDKVKKAKGESIHRTDRIQDVATLGSDVVVVGIGFILNSSDSGKTWHRTQPVGLPAFIGATICPDKTQVLISAEREAWVSVDSGKTWQPNALATEETPQYISCSASNKLWISASFSTLLNSIDQGVTWQQSTFDEDLILTYVNFFDMEHGIAVGEFGSLYSTVDGGENWSLKENHIPNEFFPLAVTFLDSQHGWVGGSSGVIFHTNDGGSTWEKEYTGVQAPIYGLSASKLGVFAVGGFGTFLERKRAVDDVPRWQNTENVVTRFYLRAIAPLGQNKIILGGGAGTLRLLVDDGSGQMVIDTVEKGE